MVVRPAAAALGVRHRPAHRAARNTCRTCPVRTARDGRAGRTVRAVRPGQRALPLLTGRHPGAQYRFIRSQQHLPHRNTAGREAAEDLVPVLLAQQCHRHHQHPAQLRQHGGGRVHHEPSPDRQVLDVRHLVERLRRKQQAQFRDDELGVVQRAVRDQIDQFACGGRFACSERTVDPDDHGSPSSIAHSGLPATPGRVTRGGHPWPSPAEVCPGVRASGGSGIRFPPGASAGAPWASHPT